MTTDHRVLILGATGRTGSRVLTELLDRGLAVRAIVRSADRLPPAVGGHSQLQVVEADLLAMPTAELVGYLAGCGTVICCLGHNVSARGLFGPPRDLVERSVRRVREAVAAQAPTDPVRLILMSSVSVNRPARADARRGPGERAYLWLLRLVLPPARDNQRAADLLVREVGPDDPSLRWVVVRPDTLTDEPLGEYSVHGALVASIRRPDRTRMSQVAHLMAELATDEPTWQQWQGRMPVVTDAAPPRA
jgi:nucleoside-diphosphate-sugar epimerase